MTITVIITTINMKKLLLLLPLFLLIGCTKEIDMPKLHAKDITLDRADPIIDFTYENLINIDDFTDEQLDELEKNGEIDTSDLVYDDEGYLVPGTYDIQISYYEDVVDCMLTVTDVSLPIFNDVSEVDVPITWSYYDFYQVIGAASPIGLPITLDFDTSQIDFNTVGDYTLIATVTDEAGRSASKEITVHIVE